MEHLNLTAHPSNTSSTLGPPPAALWNLRILVPAVFLSVCFLLGVPGNIAVMVFLLRSRRELSGLSRRLMLNLAVSDLLCLLSPPVWAYSVLYTWNLGPVACKLAIYLIMCGIYGTLLNVTLLSVQRYLHVMSLQRAGLSQAGEMGLQVGVWVVAALLSIPALVVRQPTKLVRRTACKPVYSSNDQRLALMLTEFLLAFVVPFSVMVCAYICLHRRVNHTVFFNSPRMTKLVTSIIVTFFVFWIPYHIDNILGVVAILLEYKPLLEFYRKSANIAGALTLVNSCLDPLLYAFASRNACTACSNA